MGVFTPTTAQDNILMLPLLENLSAGSAYLVAVIAINKKGASQAVYNTVETLQQPELQLIEEKIPVQAEMGDSELVVGVGLGVAVAVTSLLLLGLAVRHSSCGRAGGGEDSSSPADINYVTLTM